QSGLMVEGAGVQPHARRLPRPRLRYRRGQQLPAKPAADELRQQTEVFDLHAAVRLGFQLEIPGRVAAHQADPRFQLRPLEVVQPRAVSPPEAFEPVPVPSHGGVEEAVQFRTNNLRFSYLEGQVTGPRRAHVVGAGHFQVLLDDLEPHGSPSSESSVSRKDRVSIAVGARHRDVLDVSTLGPVRAPREPLHRSHGPPVLGRQRKTDRSTTSPVIFMDKHQLFGFTNVDQTADPDYFIRFLDEASAQDSVHAYKRATYALLGVREGQHVLDVGCGTGEDAQALARLVGPGGHVVAGGSTNVMIAAATRRAAKLVL